MKRMMPLLWAGTLVFGYLAGYAASPGGSAAARQAAAAGQSGRGQAAAQAAAPAGALPPGDYSKMQLAPDQGEPFGPVGRGICQGGPRPCKIEVP